MRTYSIIAVIAAIGLSACGTTDPYAARAEHERVRQERYVEKTLNNIPPWMSKVPISNSAVYAAGTSASSDLSMADHKAKVDAYAKLCMTAGGSTSQRTKIFKMDTENSSTETSEMAIRAQCKEVDLTGIELRDVKRIQEGNRFRTFVLVALPTGDANILKRAKEQAKLNEIAGKRADALFKEMDEPPAPASDPRGNVTEE